MQEKIEPDKLKWDILQQVKEHPEDHELLSLEDGILRVYFVTTGIYQTPDNPHTSIIAAASLNELNKYFTEAFVEDLNCGRKENWSWHSVYMFEHPSYPPARVVEKKIEPGKIFEDHGFLKIRPGFHNPADDGKPLLSYEVTDASGTGGWCNKIVVNAENSIEGASYRLENYGKTIHDIILSILKPGYVADVLPPHYSYGRR